MKIIHYYQFGNPLHFSEVLHFFVSFSKRDIDFHGSRETFRNVLHDMGFFFERNNHTTFLKEQPKIADMRFKFLKLFKYFYDQDVYARKYQDETWIFEFGSGTSFIWTNGEWQYVRAKKPKGGSRYIISHVGGEHGWVEGASLVYNSKTKPLPGDDYHGDMNREVFMKHFHKIVSLTEEPSVFIEDNASYHKCQVLKDIVICYCPK